MAREWRDNEILPFVIVADFRTGSTLLQSTLNQHPQVRCYGELLHVEEFSDNQLADGTRHELTGRQIVNRAFEAEGLNAAGFRAMVSHPLPSVPQWADAWDALSEIENLRVIYLSRRDSLAQYASISIAQQVGVWHPHAGDPVLKRENRPTIAIDPREFRRWCAEQDRNYELRRNQLRSKCAFETDYETLTEHWNETISRIQEFLLLDVIPLEQAKQLQETRPLAEVISNLNEFGRKA